MHERVTIFVNNTSILALLKDKRSYFCDISCYLLHDRLEIILFRFLDKDEEISSDLKEIHISVY